MNHADRYCTEPQDKAVQHQSPPPEVTPPSDFQLIIRHSHLPSHHPHPHLMPINPVCGMCGEASMCPPHVTVMKPAVLNIGLPMNTGTHLHHLDLLNGYTAGVVSAYLHRQKGGSPTSAIQTLAFPHVSKPQAPLPRPNYPSA